jgi:hypothetical protein
MGNIGDFDPATDGVPYDQLPAFDRYVLRRTAAMVKDMEAGLQPAPGPCIRGVLRVYRWCIGGV